MNYDARFTPRFQKRLALYASMRKRIQKEVDRILGSPYQGTERLAHAPQGLNLKGCRSTRVGQNFRIIFVICEECKIEPDCAIVIARDWQTRRSFFLMSDHRIKRMQ